MRVVSAVRVLSLYRQGLLDAATVVCLLLMALNGLDSGGPWVLLQVARFESGNG